METGVNYQYFGLFLDNYNRNKLMQVILDNPILSNLVFQRGSTLYLDHCTLLHKNQNDEEIYNSLIYFTGENKVYRIYADRIGISNKAIAFGISLNECNLPCANAKPHITICTINGGKPVNSNDICEWIPIPELNIYCELKMVK